eukprot:gene5546-6231_t
MACEGDFLDEEDEEVILAGSPLAQYLHEIGEEDFSSFPSSSLSTLKSEQSLRNVDLQVAGEGVRPIFSWPSASAHYFQKAWCSVFELFGDSQRKERFVSECRKDILEQLHNSMFLEDASITEMAEENCKIEKENLSLGNSNTQLILIFVFVVWNCTWNLSLVTDLLLTLFFALLAIFLIYYLWEKHSLSEVRAICKCAVEAVTNFLKNSDEFCLCVDKSILVIREFEVVAMGRTFYHPNLPQLKSGGQKRGMCIVLRRFLLDGMLKSFEILKNATELVVKSVPTEMKLMYKERGISNITLSEIKSSLEIIKLDADEFVSMDVLKSLACLSKAQLIEIVEMMAITLNPTSFQRKNCPDIILSFIVKLAKTFDKELSALDVIIKDIKTNCDFTKENEFKSSLDRLGAIEDYLKSKFTQTNKDLNGEHVSLEDCEIDSFRELTAAFRHGINSAKDCVEDLELRLWKPVRKDEKISNSEDVGQDDFLLPEMSNIRQPDGDVYLEGTSEPVVDSRTVVFDDTSLENELKQRQEARESKRLMNELKAIFALKKSPVGLVSFDLLKTELDIKNEEEFQDSSEELNVKPKENQNYFQVLEKGEFYDEGCNNSNDDDCYDKECSSKKEHKFGTSGPLNSFIPDLASVIRIKSNNFGISEQTLEADTFGISDNDEDD